MTATPQSMSDLPELPNELVRVGGLLSNAAYNLAQHADLSPEMRESLDKMRKQWDAARDAYTLCRATAEQAGKVEGEPVAWAVDTPYGRGYTFAEEMIQYMHEAGHDPAKPAQPSGKVEGGRALLDEAMRTLRDASNEKRHDLERRIRAHLAKPTQPAATQQPVAVDSLLKLIDRIEGDAQVYDWTTGRVLVEVRAAIQAGERK